MCALGVWFGALVMVGATAAIAFPEMKELQPSLPDFSAVPEDNWSIAAGKVMFPAFFICDVIQFVSAMLAIVSFILVFVKRRTGPGAAVRGLRLLLMTILMASLGYYMVALTPAMNDSLNSYWNAARTGDLEQAATHKATFDALHPKASAALRINALLVLLAMTLGVTNVLSDQRNPGPDDSRPTRGSAPPSDSRPEEPMLARGMR